MAGTCQNIDDYISAYDGELKERMVALRALIHSCHPDITEKIAWGIPTLSTSPRKRNTWDSIPARRQSMPSLTVSESCPIPRVPSTCLMTNQCPGTCSGKWCSFV